MNEKALQLIEDLEEASQTALLLSKRCATLAGHAAKLLESQPTAPNTTKVAICEDCKKPCGNLVAITDRHNYHDGYYCPTCIVSHDIVRLFIS